MDAQGYAPASVGRSRVSTRARRKGRDSPRGARGTSSVAFDAPRDGFGGDSRVDRDERARAHARTEHGVEEIPAEDVRRDAERLARVLGFRVRGVDDGARDHPAPDGGRAGRADRARGEARGEADRAGGEERGPAQLGGGGGRGTADRAASRSGERRSARGPRGRGPRERDGPEGGNGTDGGHDHGTNERACALRASVCAHLPQRIRPNPTIKRTCHRKPNPGSWRRRKGNLDRASPFERATARVNLETENARYRSTTVQKISRRTFAPGYFFRIS